VSVDEVEPIVGRLRGFPWSSEESVAYEAALEAINAAVGAYSAVIAGEEAKAEPDTFAISAALSGQAECARRREELDPADRPQIAAARREFAELARQVRAGRG
jgi:hypothetical protein